MRPLVLVDVDGVLNALGPPDDTWPHWEHGRAEAAGRTWPIRWSPQVVVAVDRWRAVADVRWLTTWGHAANEGLHALLGLPALPVAGTPDGEEERSTRPAGAGAAAGARAAAPAGAALAAVTPAAPDALTGRWWKFDVVRRLVAAEPGRRLVWLDDDLAADGEIRGWTRAHADCLLVAPDPRVGLVASQLSSVDRFLAAPG